MIQLLEIFIWLFINPQKKQKSTHTSEWTYYLDVCRVSNQNFQPINYTMDKFSRGRPKNIVKSEYYQARIS